MLGRRAKGYFDFDEADDMVHMWYSTTYVPYIYNIIVCMFNLIVYWRVETTQNELSQIIYS